MAAHRWIVLTFFSILIGIGLVVGLSCAMDPYGVLRDPTGRQLPFYMAERRAKFFLNQRYVPANFDGLLIGASETMCWRVPILSGAKLYNESFVGASASEEKFIIEQAVGKGHFNLAVVSLSPAITRHSNFREGLETVRQAEVLGSIHSLANGVADVLAEAHVGLRASHYSANGTNPTFIPDRLGILPLSADFFSVDSASLKDLQDLMGMLKEHGVRIVYVVPPIYKPEYDRHESEYREYLETMREALPPGPVINFNDPEYTSLTGNRNDFYDSVHMKPHGTAAFSMLLTGLAEKTLASVR